MVWHWANFQTYIPNKSPKINEPLWNLQVWPITHLNVIASCWNVKHLIHNLFFMTLRGSFGSGCLKESQTRLQEILLVYQSMPYHCNRMHFCTCLSLHVDWMRLHPSMTCVFHCLFIIFSDRGFDRLSLAQAAYISLYVPSHFLRF